MPPRHHRDFLWDETEFVLEELEAELGPAQLADDGRTLSFDDSPLVLELPLVQAGLVPGADAAATSVAELVRGEDRGKGHLEALRRELCEPLGPCCVVLVRAGAFALGLWDDDELVQHKAKKRYVTRGKGKAQLTHLKTRGKSR